MQLTSYISRKVNSSRKIIASSFVNLSGCVCENGRQKRETVGRLRYDLSSPCVSNFKSKAVLDIDMLRQERDKQFPHGLGA